MTPYSSKSPGARRVAILGGGLYAVAVLGWALSTGVGVTDGGLRSVLLGVGYGVLGMFLIAGLSLYLLGRLSLLAPLLVAVWSLGNTMYLRWFVARPHDALASYLTIWPLILGLILLAALLEFGARWTIDRTTGRLGLRVLF